MNPEPHHNTGDQRKRKASDTLTGDNNGVINHPQEQFQYASPIRNLQQQSSSSNYINGVSDPTMVCCPCIHCPHGWHDGMTMAAMKVDEVAKEAADLDSLPVGYRFIPTDEELIKHYLMKKIKNERVPKSKISDADIYESHPKDVVGRYPQAIEDGWYFFTPRNRKYAHGKRPDRQAGSGYWKATGPDKVIKENDIKIGGRKSLVYYEGHAPNWTKTKWMMHEYVIEGYVRTRLNSKDNKLDDYVLCKIYINGKMKEEGVTDQQPPRVASNGFDANHTTNVQVENEQALVTDNQPDHLLLSNQDHVNPVSFHGDNNVVVQHDSDQNLNHDRTCMSSLGVSDESVHPTCQVKNNMGPQSYQNMGSLYNIMLPCSVSSYSSPTRFNHEYSLQPPHNEHASREQVHALMYRTGSTSNVPLPPLVAPSFQEEGVCDPANVLMRNIRHVFAQHGYGGFLDNCYPTEFNGINEYIDADESKD